MVSRTGIGIAGALFLISAAIGAATQLAQSAGLERPLFQVDPAWPKIPNGWALGQVSSAAADANDHIWLLHRSRVVRAGQKTGPPVMEFDAAGNYVQGWGGPGDGYEWPRSEHGIFVDYKGFVWIGGNGDDDQILKFTKAGKFVMQIGRGGEKKANADTRNLWKPADVFVHPQTNELFVADGYGNRRIIVFDADTGAFKRMWGAFGNAPIGRSGHCGPIGIGRDESRSRAGQGSGARRSWSAAIRHRPWRQGVERRPGLRRRSRRQTRAGVHDRRQVRRAGLDRSVVRGRRRRMRQRADRREHGVLRRSGTEIPVRRRAGAPAASGCSTGRRCSRWILSAAPASARRVLRAAPHDHGLERQPVHVRGPGRTPHPEVRAERFHVSHASQRSDK